MTVFNWADHPEVVEGVTNTTISASRMFPPQLGHVVLLNTGAAHAAGVAGQAGMQIGPGGIEDLDCMSRFLGSTNQLFRQQIRGTVFVGTAFND